MDRTFTAIGALSGALAVAVGAFGAHALRERLSPEDLATFETGVRYHFYHVAGLLAVAAAAGQWAGRAARLARTSGWLFVAGTALFSGSLYVLALSGVRWLGAIAPLGGVAFIAGWLSLAWAALREPGARGAAGAAGLPGPFRKREI
ncbi:MAG TPA: DUF423 domain-containing protein [Chloroflexota bacterium]|nr:DUF423 domain-containing protein [Chloroflexota bacterium]